MFDRNLAKNLQAKRDRLERAGKLYQAWELTDQIAQITKTAGPATTRAARLQKAAQAEIDPIIKYDLELRAAVANPRRWLGGR